MKIQDVLNESSLSRVWQHVKGDKPFAILTAFRGEFNRDTNIRRNRALAADIRNLGYGFFFLDGFWVENQGTPEERKVSEDSLFVIGREGSDKKFIEQIVKLGAENNQDGVLIKSVDGINIYDKAGNVTYTLDNFNPGAAGEMYSKLRNNKRSNTFMFSEERDDIGWGGRMSRLHGKQDSGKI
jgi:hypothetical protein